MPAIEQLTLSAFDFHLFSGALPAPDKIDAAARFLVDPGGYRAIQLGGGKRELPGLLVFPVAPDTAHNHFWRHYAAASRQGSGYEAAPAEPARDRLLPLRCRPKSLALAVELPGAAAAAKVRATTWLWPFGWSSSIEFTVRGAGDFDRLRDIVALLRTDDPLFRQDAKPTTLSGVFKLLSSSLKQNLQAPAQSLSDTIALPKHIVIAAVLGKAEPGRRYADGAGGPRWAASERSRMLGALLGQTIDIAELLRREADATFLVTQLAGGSFALTDFERGTLIVLAGAAGRRARERARCLAANIRSCSIAVTALHRLTRSVERHPAANGAAAELVAAARETLQNLPLYYGNPFCRRLLAAHGALRRAAGLG